MFSASAVYHDRMLLEIKTPYDARLVERIKAEIPATHRRWAPERKTWFVQAPYDTVAIRILRYHFPDAHVDQKPGLNTGGNATSTGCACDADHRALYVCQGAPVEVIRAAYRALAKVNHPDAGGDHTSMQRINEAYARIGSGVRA